MSGTASDDCAVAGYYADDMFIETSANVALPLRLGGDVGLHGGVTVRLGDLGVAAGEEDHAISCGLEFGVLDVLI